MFKIEIGKWLRRFLPKIYSQKELERILNEQPKTCSCKLPLPLKGTMVSESFGRILVDYEEPCKACGKINKWKA